MPGDITPSPTGARRTPSPTAAAATPAPTPRGEVPETEKLPQVFPPPTYFPTDMPTTSPIKSGETTVPITPDPTYSPTEAFPTYAPTSSSVEATPKPTAKSTSTDPDDSSETGFLGFTLEENTEYDLMVNAGLTIKRIAKKNQKVQFENGNFSAEKWHLWMDGGAVIHLPKGGYAYVSNSEHDDGKGGVYGLYLNDDHEVTGYKKLMGKFHMPCNTYFVVITLALLTPVSWINPITHEILQAEQLGIVPVEPRLGKLGLAAKSMVRDNAGRLIRILTVNSTRVLPRRSSVDMMEVNMNL